MAEHSNIAWTRSTFNPWIGCTKVGPGCGGRTHWGAGVSRYRPRWNLNTVQPGRRATLSKGYGKSSRLNGVITWVSVGNFEAPSKDYVACYGENAGPAISFGIGLLTPYVQS